MSYLCIFSAGPAACRVQEWPLISLCFGWDSKTGEANVTAYILRYTCPANVGRQAQEQTEQYIMKVLTVFASSTSDPQTAV